MLKQCGWGFWSHETFLPTGARTTHSLRKGLSDEECDVAVTTLARCKSREVRKNVYEKKFDVHAEQTILFLLEDLHNCRY